VPFSPPWVFFWMDTSPLPPSFKSPDIQALFLPSLSPFSVPLAPLWDRIELLQRSLHTSPFPSPFFYLLRCWSNPCLPPPRPFRRKKIVAVSPSPALILIFPPSFQEFCYGSLGIDTPLVFLCDHTKHAVVPPLLSEKNRNSFCPLSIRPPPQTPRLREYKGGVFLPFFPLEC